MSQYTAPPVECRAVRSARVGWCIGGALLGAAMVLAFWAAHGAAGHTGRIVLAHALWAVCGVGALAHWWRSAQGVLVWDGRAWHFRPTPQHERTVALQLHLDLQHTLLVRLYSPQHRAQWLWLERASQPERWSDVRRAVYSPRPASADIALPA